MAEDVYIYWLRVPPEKSDAFVAGLAELGLMGPDNLRVMHTPDGEGEED